MAGTFPGLPTDKVHDKFNRKKNEKCYSPGKGMANSLTVTF